MSSTPTASAPSAAHTRTDVVPRAASHLSGCTGRRTPDRSRRLAFLIDRLNHGGAARQLVVLAGALQQAGHAVVVVVFYAGNAFEAELRDSGVRVRALGKRGRWDVGFLPRLLSVLRQERPDVLHGYLPVPNILAVLVRPFLPPVKIVWAVRASNMLVRWYGWIPRILDGAGVLLSRYPDLIIANSFAGRRHVTAIGYPPHKLRVVPNGIDTGRFAPCAVSRARFRERWRIGTGEKLVGIVGRLDPIKDHATFFHAARVLADRHDVRFACVGDGPERWRMELQRLAAELQLTDKLVWVPDDANMTDVYNGLDVLCSSSLSEGFPNVVGEAMACGVPCVVTDAGDSARVVGEHGHVVLPGDAQGMADCVRAVLDTPAPELARMAAARRAWIVRQFPVGDLVRASERAIVSLLRESTP